MSHARHFATVTESPQALSSKELVTIDSIMGHNPDGANVAYLKIYIGDSAPDGSSIPKLSVPFLSADARQWAVFASFDGPLWIAASTDPAAGLTAPSSDLLTVTVVLGG